LSLHRGADPLEWGAAAAASNRNLGAADSGVAAGARVREHGDTNMSSVNAALLVGGVSLALFLVAAVVSAMTRRRVDAASQKSPTSTPEASRALTLSPLGEVALRVV
jgi:TRAP-type C4-dicarboxylate transport system permease small subunit